jgi:hypothetical protein
MAASSSTAPPNAVAMQQLTEAQCATWSKAFSRYLRYDKDYAWVSSDQLCTDIGCNNMAVQQVLQYDARQAPPRFESSWEFHEDTKWWQHSLRAVRNAHKEARREARHASKHGRR